MDQARQRCFIPAFLGAFHKRQAILDKPNRIAFTLATAKPKSRQVPNTLNNIKLALKNTPSLESEPHPPAQAAVAAILRPGPEDLELLFIQRSQRKGDPWSGHLAFPGGRLEAEDPTPRAAAIRETREEIGLILSDSEFIGDLVPLAGLALPISVYAFTFVIEQTASFTLSDEVQSTFWIPFKVLLDPNRRTEYRHQQGTEETPHEALQLLAPSRPLLWGITYRFTQQLLQHAVK